MTRVFKKPEPNSQIITVETTSHRADENFLSLVKPAELK